MQQNLNLKANNFAYIIKIYENVISVNNKYK